MPRLLWVEGGLKYSSLLILVLWKKVQQHSFLLRRRKTCFRETYLNRKDSKVLIATNYPPLATFKGPLGANLRLNENGTHKCAFKIAVSHRCPSSP